MSTAIAHFSEPYAWMARGLLDINWEDMSSLPTHFQCKVAWIFSRQLDSDRWSIGLKLLVLAGTNTVGLTKMGHTNLPATAKIIGTHIKS